MRPLDAVGMANFIVDLGMQLEVALGEIKQLKEKIKSLEEQLSKQADGTGLETKETLLDSG